MGCGSSSGRNLRIYNDNIRVVHLDGRIEDYDVPIKVNQIIQNPNQDVLCTKSQLLSPTSSRVLKSDCELELGNLYFMIPISAFRNEASLMDMAHMVNKLTNIAKSARLKECSKPLVAQTAHGAEYCQSGPGQVEGGKGSVWKPVLDTIGEQSFNGRSESELQDYF